MLQLNEKPNDSVAWKRFEQIAFTDNNHETYRYVRLNDLYSQSFSLPKHVSVEKRAEEGVLVFVNGVYAPALSQCPKPFIVLPLSEAYKVYGSFLKPRIRKQLEEENDPFAALNSAYFTEGLFIYLPPHSRYEQLLKVVHIIDGIQNPTLLTPRIHLFAGKCASAKLIFSQHVTHPHLLINTYVDIHLEESAHVQTVMLAKHTEASHLFMSLRATLKSQSVLKSYNVTNGGATSRDDYRVSLEEEGAHAELYGVWNLKNKNQHHVHVFMDHKEPHCTSLQKFKGVLWDASRSSFEGKIFVHDRAQKTEAFQMNNNLLLSKGAVAYAKPNLEIFADDVKASHGATVGQLNDEHLFYFATRGLSKELASNLLVRGFIDEIISEIPDQELRQEAREVIS